MSSLAEVAPSRAVDGARFVSVLCSGPKRCRRLAGCADWRGLTNSGQPSGRPQEALRCASMVLMVMALAMALLPAPGAHSARPAAAVEAATDALRPSTEPEPPIFPESYTVSHFRPGTGFCSAAWAAG